MDSLEKSKLLYQRYAQRFKNQGDLYQASFYQKGVEVISTSATMEEAQQKLSSPELIEEGQIVQKLDSWVAKKESAEKNQRNQLADICEQAIQQSRTDFSAAMDSTLDLKITEVETK